jgi:hypothetical protein
MIQGRKPMKIIVYALGRLFEQQRERMDWKQVIALADKNISSEMADYEIPVITPELICSFEYDYVVIFSNQFYEEIRMELTGVYFVPKGKIIPWIEIIEEKGKITSQMLEAYRSFLVEKQCRRILDVGMSVLPNCCLTKIQFLTEDCILEGVCSETAVRNDCLYDDVYNACEDCKEIYDAVLVWGDIAHINEILGNIHIRVRYILAHTGYLWEETHVSKKMDRILGRYGKVSYISNLWGILWITDTQSKIVDDEISIYVAMHKKYNVQSNELYIPLCAGKFRMQEYLTEQKGDNISYLNAKINECTLLYWIWKNTDSRYVGLNHYRRYFYNNDIKSMDNYLDIAHASDILREYDIILTKVQSMGYTTVYEQIYNSINHDLCERGYCLIRNGIKKRQPDYLQAFEDVMKGHTTFLCNMFVTRREILDRYCEWLFSFLIEAAEQIDIKGYDSYSQRVIGFYAERMWTVWLRRNKLKIKELPYVIVK